MTTPVVPTEWSRQIARLRTTPPGKWPWSKDGDPGCVSCGKTAAFRLQRTVKGQKFVASICTRCISAIRTEEESLGVVEALIQLRPNFSPGCCVRCHKAVPPLGGEWIPRFGLVECRSCLLEKWAPTLPKRPAEEPVPERFIRTNEHPAKCSNCGEEVAPGEGELTRGMTYITGGAQHWVTHLKPCWRRNRFAGECEVCKELVLAGEGVTVQASGVWRLRHVWDGPPQVWVVLCWEHRDEKEPPTPAPSAA